MVALTARGDGDWKPPVLTTVASEGTGIAGLLAALDQFRAAQAASGADLRRRRDRARRELLGLSLTALQARLVERAGTRLVDLAEAVRAGELDPYAAADRLLSEILPG
jgi:LAO/AO transport system kinase